jgi:hypothetical protein
MHAVQQELAEGSTLRNLKTRDHLDDLDVDEKLKLHYTTYRKEREQRARSFAIWFRG